MSYIVPQNKTKLSLFFLFLLVPSAVLVNLIEWQFHASKSCASFLHT